MVTAEPKIKLTYDDYAKTPEDERYELIDGVLILVSAPNVEHKDPNMEHQSIQVEVGWRVVTFVKDGDLGWVFNPPTDVLLADHDVVQPDLVFVSREREHVITDANIRGAPDLVVEILSPSSATRDRRDKFDLYARHGVAEYWLISPEARIVRVFVLRDGVFDEVGRYGENDTLTSATLEGLEIDLSGVFGA